MVAIFKTLAFTLLVTVCVSHAYNFQSGSNGQVAWANGCNFFGNDISQQPSAGEACGDLCIANTNCNYFAWDNGVCYMKQATNPPITDMNNAVCGWVVSRVGGTRGPLIWQEEFDTLDTGRWKHLITGWRGGNNEFQYYDNLPENSYAKGGNLFIKPTLTADRFSEDFLYNGVLDLNQEGCNVDIDGGCVVTAGADIINPIQSARMVTENSFSMTYGTIEVRARMPAGDWIWPAIWMLPTDYVYGGWPRSGEIDIVESRGNADFSCSGAALGRQLAGSTLHWGPDSGQNRFDLTHWEKLNQANDFAASFHTYRVEWLTTGLQFYIDDEFIGATYPPAGGFWQMGGFQGNNIWSSGSPMAPFDQKFHFVLNVAVGGGFFGDGCVNKPFNKPWSSSSGVQMKPFWEAKDQWLPTWNAATEDNAMQIDYIRVYSLA